MLVLCLQLAAAVLKLEDELTKLIKTIGSALLKDATPDDLAMMSQLSASATGANGTDSTSEFGRLQRLPGFARLQRMLFYNLMTARPDISAQNIRIEHIGKTKPPKCTYGPASHFEDPAPVPGRKIARASYGGAHSSSDKHLQRADSEGELANNGELDENGALSAAAEPALGRATIKSISKLIYERDHNRPVAVVDAASL
jgi:hypothetical protein